MYENIEASRIFTPKLPILARMDGKNFSRFTKNMNKPFDDDFVCCMNKTIIQLIKKTKAVIGYVASDEISLLFEAQNTKSEIFFGGRISKITSVLAAMASVAFYKSFSDIWVDDRFPIFDCRCWQMPSRNEVINYFIEREQSTTRNSITMVARSIFSHKELEKKNGKEKQEMLFQKKGINWNDYPSHLKRGSYYKRQSKLIPMDKVTRLEIPEKHRPESGTMVKRSIINKLDLPQLSKISNRIEVIFNGVTPIEFTDIEEAMEF